MRLIHHAAVVERARPQTHRRCGCGRAGYGRSFREVTAACRKPGQYRCPDAVHLAQLLRLCEVFEVTANIEAESARDPVRAREEASRSDVRPSRAATAMPAPC